MNPGHLESFGHAERREQAHQALGEHGLAGPRWTHQQQVVGPRRRHLQRQPAERLARHVGQVGPRIDRLRRRGGERKLGPGSLTPEDGHGWPKLGDVRTSVPLTSPASTAHTGGTTTVAGSMA